MDQTTDKSIVDAPVPVVEPTPTPITDPVVAVVEPTPTPIPDPVPVPVAPIPEPTPPVMPASTVGQIVSLDDVSIAGKIAYQNILDYITNMAPRKPVSPDEGSRHQVRLYRSLVSIFNNLDNDFNLIFGSVLSVFNEHKDGVFHESRVFRFFDTMALSKDERDSFQRLLNLIKLTAEPKGRTLALKQINLNATLEFITEKGKQKVLKFFNVK